MIAAEDTVLILLAAGRSSRFEGGNKLEAEFLKKPVGLHVVTALEDIPFKARFVVRDGCSLDFKGYRVIHNDQPDDGMARSVRMGVECAKAEGAKAVLIALADMPRVTAAHIYRLLDAADSNDAVVASSDGTQPRPPAVFGAGRFDFLMTLEGDAGARDLVKAGKHVVTSPAELIDIDTPEDLEALRALVHAPELTITRPQG
ncbi:nucleotidyltransferase family protein [uncultured Sphingomonas sp.]|uniref:nucleotidyltransferase family protein n=1 Tax=uncultured Sphingomonas sp. TaxID=158754 RepID=UPI0025F8023F|nr:nucleotidyltransferase family protein [uncultured Sphingomonas sp.]